MSDIRSELALVLNRDFQMPEDNWYHLIPTGEFSHPSGISQVIDKAACDGIVNHFREDAKAPNFPGLLIDFDHFSHDSGKPSEAAGWITELRNTDHTGVWGRIRWSDVGESAVKGGRYRLVSPVWRREDCEAVSPTGDTKTKNRTTDKPDRLRPLRLHRVALTNDPNLRGMVPLSNRADSMIIANKDGFIEVDGHPVYVGPENDTSEEEMEDKSEGTAGHEKAIEKYHEAHKEYSRLKKYKGSDDRGKRAAHDASKKRLEKARAGLHKALNNRFSGTTSEVAKHHKMNIAKLIGLPDDATDEAIEAGVSTLKNRVATLEQENNTLHNSQIESDLDTYKNRFAPEAKETWKKLLVANRDSTLEVLKAIPAIPDKTKAQPLTNRATARTPAPNAQMGEPTQEALTEAIAQLRNRNPRLSYAQAFEQVTREQPALVGLRGE